MDRGTPNEMDGSLKEKTGSPPRQTLMLAACVVFAAWVGSAILSSRCLYADGAHEFIRVLQAQNFVTLMWSRHFAFYAYEFPLVLAIKLGVTNLAGLRFAFGLGCFSPWPLALAACYWMAPRHFWLAAMGCAAGYLNASFMAVGEHILAHALFWPALFALLFAQPLKPMAAFFLLAAAAGLLFSYESQILLCVPLAALAGWRSQAERQNGNRLAWAICLVAAALFLAAICIGWFSVLMPELPSNFIGFKTSTAAILGHPGWTLTWTLAWLGLVLAACFSETIWRGASGKIGFYVLFLAVAVWGTWPLLAPGRLDNGVEVDNRSLDALVPLALFPVALMLRFRPRWFEVRRERIVAAAAVLLLAQSLWQISATICWYRDVVCLQDILATKRGIVPVHSTVLAADGMEGRDMHPDSIGGRFDWTWPCLSIALAPNPKINCLVCSEVFLDPAVRRYYWQPFDPFKPETLPDLEHFGLDFSGYVSALNGSNQK